MTRVYEACEVTVRYTGGFVFGVQAALGALAVFAVAAAVLYWRWKHIERNDSR